MKRGPHHVSAIFAAVVASNANAATDDGKTLFETQCGVCHVVSKADPPRQGPFMAGIIGRKAGMIADFPYSDGLKAAAFVWDATRIDAWITDPQAMISDSYMVYKQANPVIRAAIIEYLATLKSE